MSLDQLMCDLAGKKKTFAILFTPFDCELSVFGAFTLIELLFWEQCTSHLQWIQVEIAESEQILFELKAQWLVS